MIIAITGISSRLGLALVPKLQSDPCVERIIGIDVTGYPANPDKITFVKADVRDRARIESALKDVDLLFHLAFIVAPHKLPDTKTIYDININGSKTVFKAAAKNKITKIIYLSSLTAYGHLPESPQEVTEDAQILGAKTTNFYYSYTKGVVESFLDHFEKEYPDVALIRLRPPIIGRPESFAEEFNSIRSGRKSSRTLFPLNHNGKKPLQLLHEDDLIDVLLMMMKKDIGSIYNIGARPIMDLYGFAKNEYNHELKPRSYALNNLFLGLHRIWPIFGWIQAWKYTSILNTEKVEKEFNWKPKFTTEDILRAALDSPM